MAALTLRRRGWVMPVVILAALVAAESAIAAETPAAEKKAQQAAPPPKAIKPLPSIEGRVTDRDGKPVIDALVQWGYVFDPIDKLQQTTTDADGKYQLKVRAWGVHYRLGISAEGMAPQWLFPCTSRPPQLEEVLDDPQNLPAKTADFKLERQHRLTGVVIDHEGRPIPAVTIRAVTANRLIEMLYSTSSHGSSHIPSHLYPMPIPSATPRTTSTSPDGSFVLDHLPADKVQLTLETPYRHTKTEHYAVDGEAKITMFGSGRRGIVRIRVIDSVDNDPVVEYVAQVRRGKPQPVRTEDGRMELAGDFLEGDRYAIYVYSKHYALTTAAAMAMPRGSNDETEVRLKPGEPMSGQLLEEDTGKPIPNGQLLHAVFVNGRHQGMDWADSTRFNNNSQMLTEIQHATTDEQGNFWFSEWPKLHDGTQFILTPGYARTIVNPTDRSPPGDDGRVQIKLAPEAAVSGTLVRDGKPQPGVEIFVQRLESRGKFEEKYEQIRTDAEGKFRIGSLAAGKYDISYWTYPTHILSKAKAIAKVKLARGEQRTLEPFTIGEIGVRKDSPDE